MQFYSFTIAYLFLTVEACLLWIAASSNLLACLGLDCLNRSLCKVLGGSIMYRSVQEPSHYIPKGYLMIDVALRLVVVSHHCHLLFRLDPYI